MAMQCYTDLIAPTAVTHSVSLPFLSSTANNLVIAKSSLLQIFSFKSIIANAKDGAGSPEGLPSQNLLRLQTGDLDSPLRTPRRRTQRSERTHTTKFVLVAQYELSGTVIGLARVKTMRSKSGGEALLVALRNAKLSLLEWDPERYCMSTVSIHYYEREDLQGSPWSPQQSSCVNYLAVDPSSRCAALKFGARSVAILPFHQAGDDLVMDDYDPEFDINASKANKSPTKTTNGESATSYTPYGASFALSLLMLDSNLDHPIHLAFLHEYREPTFGVLSSRLRISSALLHERQEMVSYTVYTLDLEQRASTTLLSIPALPYDLHTVLPLPLPIGGALLVGFNELIHVDQAGKTNGIAVNEFAKQSSSFPLAQQSGLDLKLEGCIVEHLGTPGGEMLLLLQTGDLVTLEFKRDGRSISGLLLHALSSVEDGFRLKAAASCVSNVGRGRIFVGSEEGDSLILGWSRKSGKLQQRRVSVKMEIDNEGDASDGEEDDVEDDDDLYAESKPAVAAPVKFSLVDGTNEADDYTFRIHDTLRSLAPFVDLVFAASEITGLADERPHSENPLDPQLMASIGKGRAGAICKLSRRIIPDLRAKYELEGVNGVWPLSIKKGSDIDMDQGLNVDELDQRCNFMIISRTSPNGNDQAFAFSLLADAEGIDRQLDEFDSDTGLTVDIGIFAGGTRVIHVVKSEVRTYDNDLGLAQIFPMADDDSAPGPKIIAASFAEPYILLIRDDDSAMVLKAEESGDLEEVEGGALFQSTPWVSGSLFDDSNDIFRLESDEGSDDEAGNILMFLLSAGGGLKIFRISDLDKPIYTADGLSFLPPFLSAEFTGRRSTARETLVDILVSELGDATAKAPFMILQSANNDITIYQPFQCPVAGKSITTLRFVKLSIPRNLEAFEDGLENGYHEEPAQILRAIQDLNGYSAVCVSGPNPSLIIKSASSLPKIIPLKLKGIRSLSGFHTQGCPKGLIYVDLKGFVHAAQLPQDSEYSTGWVTQQVYAAGENIDTFEYHPTSDRYVLGTSEKVVFKLPDDELHYEWSLESDLLPQIDQGTIKVLDPSTWTVTDSYILDHAEVVMCIKTMSLEVSENTHARRPLVVVGTTVICGEDLTAQGRIYIFDIIPVVPEPDHPETDRKLKLIAKEEVKGAVTALSGLGSEGFLLAAQGQKCMVRGLKEDGTLLPVAFMDMQCYVSVAKELRGTGLCVMGDAMKGVWLTGYTEDPYQLRLFGKSSTHLEVVTAEFFPDGENLYIIVIDTDSNLHIFQFNPDHPKSLAGTRLLPLTAFHTGSFHHRSYLLPPRPNKTPTEDTTSLPHHILLTSPLGTLSLLSPLPPTGSHSYSQMQSLANHLQNTLLQPAGLNPKMFRASTVDVGLGGRGVVDGNLLRRVGEEGGSGSVGKIGNGRASGGVRGWF